MKRQAETAQAELAAKSGQGEPTAAGGKGAGAGSPAVKSKAEPVIFRIGGAEAWDAARRQGWRFFPRGAGGSLDGVSTFVEIQPGVLYSKVDGPVMTQRRTLAGWGRISENTFYLFADGQGRSRSLAKGWTVRDIRLSGDPFQWVVRPAAGAASPSLAIQLAGGKGSRDSVVRLEGLVLQGPGDAKDWREAFAGR